MVAFDKATGKAAALKKGASRLRFKKLIAGSLLKKSCYMLMGA